MSSGLVWQGSRRVRPRYEVDAGRGGAVRRPWGRGGWACGLGVVASLVGCGGEAPIRHYRIPTPAAVYAANHVAQPGSAGSVSAAPTDRMLGAIVPHGDQAWYFKLTGPDREVAGQEAAFRGLIESLTFDAATGQPSWTLPEKWQEKGGAGQRLATLEIPTEAGPLEVSVISLATGDIEQSRLDNVNRWRRQMGLAPVAAGELESVTQAVDVAGRRATLVNLLGRFGGMSGGSALTGSLPPQAASPSAAAVPAYRVPEGWVESQLDAFSRAALEVRDGGQTARTTVSLLNGTGGGLLANVNRWRNQVGLAAWSEADLRERGESLELDGISGTYVEALPGDAASAGEAIIGWIGLEAGRSWFVKMKGPAPLVRSQRENLRSFLESIRFSTPDGARDGQ